MTLDEQTKTLRSLGITRPTVLIDQKKVLRNIDQMLSKAKASGSAFRPHFKTHQSGEVGDWFRQRGVNTITVSSVAMASYFADHGWNDITIAIPVNPLEIDEINRLSQKIILTLLVDRLEAVGFLESALTGQVNTMIKIDVGYGRAGVFYQKHRSGVGVDETNQCQFPNDFHWTSHPCWPHLPCAFGQQKSQLFFRKPAIGSIK